jgi:putative nucleotidyltransferase with HDIG domain
MPAFHFPHPSIRTKLTIPYIVLALLIAIAGGVIVTQAVLGSLEERFTNQLIETRKLASESMVREENRLLDTLRLLTHVQGMAEPIRQQDKHQILDLVYPITFNAGEDAALVLDSQGRIITSILKSDSTGEYLFPQIDQDISQIPFVAKVVAQEVDSKGDKYSGVVLADWGNYFFVSGPVKDQDGNLVGVILVGKSLKDLTAMMREETLAEVTLYDSNSHPISSTFLEMPFMPPYDSARTTANPDQESLMRDFTSNHIAYTELLGPWQARDGEDLGILGTALPKTFLVRTGNLTRFNVTVVFVVSIGLALLLGLYLSDLITRPILRLKQAAMDVAKGDLEVRVESRGGDEVAVLAQSFNEMVANLRHSKEDLMSAYDKTIEGWSKALELRDAQTEGHTLRAVELTLELARALKIDEEEMPNIRRGVLLHDIGKIGIPDKILLKPGPLTEEEREIIKKHPVIAREILEQIDFLRPSMDIPAYHHEKWDGSGYPTGMAGEEIPIAVRIFAVVDVWDAITSERPYRKAFSDAEALEYIRNSAGKHFDPQIVKGFLDIMQKHLMEEKGNNLG